MVLNRRQLLQRGGAAALSLSPLAALTAASSRPNSQSAAGDRGKLIVHEWGTFLAVQGSDGVTLGGMVASEEVLPPFVESRSLATFQRAQIRMKMETPVTYFYTDRPRVLNVRVEMPRGLLTHWYPMVSAFGPNPSAEPSAARPSSFLSWERAELIPPTGIYRNCVIHTKQGQVFAGVVMSENAEKLELLQSGGGQISITKQDIEASRFEEGRSLPTLWRVKADDTWRFSRQTDAAIVKVRSRSLQDWSEHDYEKFLFYRGLGTYALPLALRAAGSNDQLQLTLRNQGKQPLRGMFAVWVERDALRFAALKDLPGGASASVAVTSTLGERLKPAEGVPQMKQAVTDALVSAGLYLKEAQAMVNTWEKGYFRTEGLRVLYVLPRETVDALIPLKIEPAPDQLVRVMVGRTEVLTPELEKQIEQWIAELGSETFAIREAADTALGQLGRLGEPALRRVASLTRDPEVRRRAEQLIQKAAAQ